MGSSTKTVGNAQSQGFASQFMNFLQGGMTGQGFGTGGPGPHQATQGIAGVLNGLLSPGAGPMGGALGTLIQQSQTRGLNSLKGQFGGSGGAGLGTPGAVAQSLFQAQAAPQAATAIGGLQMNAINSILPYFSQIAGKGLPQTQEVVQPSPFAQAMGAIAPIAGAAANIFAPGVGSALGSAAGSFIPQMSPEMLAGTMPNVNFAPGPNLTMPYMNPAASIYQNAGS